MPSRRRRRYSKARKKWYLLVIPIFLLVLVGGFFLLRPKADKTAQTASSQSASSSAPVKAKAKAKEVAKKAQWLPSKNDNQLPILMFHYASSNPTELTDSNWMPDSTLEANFKALKTAGYTTVNVADAIKVITSKTRPSKKMVWLTFDDGSLTLYRDVFPLLKKYQLHATAFIITGFVNNNQGGILNWAQIKEMAASGLVDFQSHTVSHLDLGTLATSDATYQLQQSKVDLDKELKQKTNIICYPAGGYNQETLSIAQSLGYQYGLLDPGRNGAVAKAATLADGLLTLPRFRMADTTDSQAMMEMLKPSELYNASN